MSPELQALVDAARTRPFGEAEREAQRRSFAYGNAKIENDRITREMVAEQDELLKAEELEVQRLSSAYGNGEISKTELQSR